MGIHSKPFPRNQSHEWARWHQISYSPSFLCFGFFHVIHANENENEEEVAPLYLNSNHLNSRVARSAEPYYYSYWNDLKRGDPSHLLRFNKRGGMQDDHLLRFAKKYDDHLLRFAKKQDDHLLRFAKKDDDHLLRFAKKQDDHLLRFAKKQDHLL